MLFSATLAAAVVWWFVAPFKPPISNAGNLFVNEDQADAALQQAAAIALGQKEGTIIVMDPQTGRVRAVVNPQLAFESSFAPGSTIKPFTALAALRAGLIDKNSRTLCRERYTRKDFATVCAHLRNLPPLNPAEAIAYSCNYYFGTLGERLNEELLSDTLNSFGFGAQTFSEGDHDPKGSRGTLLLGKDDPRNSVGEGDYLQATPIQLITAYSALVNGGQLFAPSVAALSHLQVSRRAQLNITPDQRAVIIEGMRGAVRYGTAANAHLNSPAHYIFGKTGTSTPTKGFRTQGWFVGFAAAAVAENLPAPADIQLAVLIFLKNAHGANAAEISQPIFEEFNRLREQRGDVAANKKMSLPLNLQNMTAGESSARVRVHLVRENITKEMSREEYVLGVVAAEGSSEDQPEALKALAVAARTYAVKNAGRHGRAGFDFCTTTHCQRYQASGRPTFSESSGSRDHAGALSNSQASAAVRDTEGEILRDEGGRPADAYFSASCGGMTANLQTLWGANAPAYLRGVPDEYCSTMPHNSWTDVISSASLLQGLRSDARSDPGAQLHEVVVTRRDSTGRAELVLIDGEHRRTVSGWDFKIIVGRKLGWNWLKSSRFEIARSGSNFIFRGSGFGHGLGLCQEGAHVMARRGASYRQILAKYFPTTSVAKGAEDRIAAHDRRTAEDDQQPWILADFLWTAGTSGVNSANESMPAISRSSYPAARLTISSEHFRISYPTGTLQRDAEGILKTLEATRSDLLHRISTAGVSLDRFHNLDIFISDSTGNFVGRTGQPSWAAAATKGSQMELQPIEVLRRRGVLNTTLRHELVHALIDAVSHDRAPRWLAEGTALYVAGEGPMIARYAPPAMMTAAEIEQALAHASSAEQMRQAYAAAYLEVRKLVKKNGERSLWEVIAKAGLR